MRGFHAEGLTGIELHYATQLTVQPLENAAAGIKL